MKTILSIAMLAAGAANAAGTVELLTPNAYTSEGYVVLDAPGTVRFMSGSDPTKYAWIASGVGEPYYETGTKQIPSYPFRVTTQVVRGYTCTTECSIHFQTTPAVATCPGDGANLTYSHLAFKLDGVLFYDEPQLPDGGVCYVTPAPIAVKTWTAPVLTFTNPSADRATDTATFVLYDTAYLYSQHTFTVMGSNAGCSTLLKNIGTRFAKRMVEAGFQCYAKLAPGETATVVVQ